tara:strand:- start:2008 stop:3369 length:1362 start_codon:yes stop_codon:yes gene_type:complete
MPKKAKAKTAEKKARALAILKTKKESKAKAKELEEAKAKELEEAKAKILKEYKKREEKAVSKNVNITKRKIKGLKEEMLKFQVENAQRDSASAKIQKIFRARNRRKEEINRKKEERNRKKNQFLKELKKTRKKKIKQKLEVDFAKQSLKQKQKKSKEKSVFKGVKRRREIYLSGDRTKMTPLEIRNRELDIRLGKLPADYFSSGVSEEFLNPKLSIEKKKKEPEKRLQLVATNKFLNEQAIDTKIRLGQVPANYRSERAKKIEDFEKLFVARKYRRNRAIEKNDKKEERKSYVGMRVPLSVSQPAVNKSKIEHLDHSRGLSIGKFRNLSTGLFRKAIPIDERKRELGQYVLNDKGGREPEPFSQNGPAPEPELSRGSTPSFGLATPLDRIGRRKPKVVSKVRPNLDIIRSSTDRPSYQPRTQSQTTRTRRRSLGGPSTLTRRPSLGANPEDLE